MEVVPSHRSVESDALRRRMDHQNETLLSAIVEGSPYAKVLVDDRGLITLINAQAEKLFGWTRDELLGQSIDVLVPERYREGHSALRTHFHAAPAARPMGAGRDLYGRRKDGSEVPIEIGLNPIDTGTATFTLAAISDITERRRAEELRLTHNIVQQHASEVEELNRELSSASRFKSQFVATMSHELRTPLTAIIGAAELLTGEQLGERSRLYVQTISESAEGLFALINSILDFSKIEAGGLNLHLKTVQIESVVESAADAVANLARENGISVYTYVDPLIPSVHGDGDCLRQILLNLLGNAVKFTEHGQIVARVYPTEVSDKDVKLRFEVQDTGIGILPQEVSRLFEPFAQVDSSPARRFGGTGLGLSISKRMVELMGGEIGVHSEPGVGSRFWFTVPFARAIELSPTPNRSLDGVAALVISGDELFVQIIERYLMSWLITCRSVNTAVDIVKALEPGDPRSWVAVVDLDTVEGREASHAVQVARAILGTRVITVGGDGPFRKPVRQSYLFDAIVNACAGESCPVSAAPPTRTRTKTTSSVSLDAPVLIAEDNVRLQPLLKLQFDQLGIPMTLVSDGQEALDAVRQTSYAMVFMDCQMPNVDGLSATRAIRAEELQSGLHIPIIAMTADAFAEDRDACFAAGMDDYLAKPVRVADLGAMIERWCRRSAAPRQV